MPRKIALAIMHGIGNQKPDFADGMKNELLDRFANKTGLSRPVAETWLVVEPVHWAPVLAGRENRLWQKVTAGGELDFISLRRFMVEFAADAIAYQPLPEERSVYEEIHVCFAQALQKLAGSAGPDALLAVISHSLGTVIASNYFYDLHHDLKGKPKKPKDRLIPAKVEKLRGDTPLERGETLLWFFTMGSPIALWSLRYQNPEFGKPITVPAPKATPEGKLGGWINFYDEDDVIGYPMKTLNDEYRKAILADIEVNSGGWLSSWNPLSHNGYWTDNDVTKPIAERLAQTWKNT